MQSLTMLDLNERVNLLCGDFREVGKQIPDNSIDMIFTDPPYAREFIPLYRDLGVFAKRVLKPIGNLICYSGKYFLPDVIKVLTKSLIYRWVIISRHTGNVMGLEHSVALFPKYKMLLWYSKERHKPKNYFVDMITSEYQGKDYHPWQQSTAEPEYLIEKFTNVEQTVCDPFLGSGTTAIPCIMLNRKFIGIEIDPETFKIAEKRISESRKTIPISQYMSD